MVSKFFLKVSLVVMFTLCFARLCEAKVKLPAFISDGMVLQRGQNLCVWGMADPGEKVVVNFLDNKYQTCADVQGNWKLTLPPMKAGGPYTMTVNEIQLKNILIGDVWLCSGQSNMELPVSRVTDMFRSEVEKDSNSMIHYIKTPLDYNFHAPQADIKPSAWIALTPENAMSFSAVAYFFAKDLYAKTKVPVGLINSSVGGSPIEAWISEEGLKSFPLYLNSKNLCESDKYVADVKELENERQNLWNITLYKSDAGLHGSQPWYMPEYNDSSWIKKDLFDTTWATNGLNPINGSHWFSKEFDVPQKFVGQEATLRLGRIIDADSAYVNGTFVGTVSYQYPPRIYKIPAHLLKVGKNKITVRLISYGGPAGFVKDKPYKILFNEGEIDLRGEWKYKPGVEMPSMPSQTFFQYKPVGLYNAMIAPLLSYKFAGVIWYQGESNVERYNEYDVLLSTLINDWRNKLHSPELPFLIVQLPNYMKSHSEPVESYWAELRDKQFKISRTVSNTALVVAIDLGEWNDIHPLNKKAVGHRLSLQAQKLVYGDKKLVADGPVYKSVSIEGNKMILTFCEGTDDLQPVTELKGFEIAGTDGVFKWADAKVEGHKVIVCKDGITAPVAVRYGWDDNPVGINLTNKAGIPASPFRTKY
ncbi:sialate O-acetylesterase [uncultured Bacteroides sp.]|uniref:sialate O-acetylesterase n=1 Tax=uncultured Bacteroides sp. TaxID=162156 RepID=UPI002AA7FE56|nr:sialate O-acetylesterase [uncultured Bacteroides sp.]